MNARTHVALRSDSSLRARSSAPYSRSIGSSITRYANRLTKRDYEILIELHDHRVLTTSQIYELHFDTFTRASKRMLQLYRLGLVERFRPHAPLGSAPWHYTLDEPGARVVAARLEIDFSKFPFKKARIFDVVASPQAPPPGGVQRTVRPAGIGLPPPGLAVRLDGGAPGRPPMERGGEA